MGTINYKTSDYITMGIEPTTAYDVEQDAGLLEELQENAQEYGTTLEEEIERLLQDNEECDRDNAETILNKYNFYYYHITLQPGYYDGFYIDIENNFGLCYDDHEEKKEAQKEITEIKKMLYELAGVGLVACFPGWCTTYKDYKGTIQEINNAIKEMREEARTTPTWRNYMRETA